MTALAWIIVGGILMSSIAMVGSITLLLKPATLDRILLPLQAQYTSLDHLLKKQRAETACYSQVNIAIASSSMGRYLSGFAPVYLYE